MVHAVRLKSLVPDVSSLVEEVSDSSQQIKRTLRRGDGSKSTPLVGQI